jgi:hypothetical protein
MGSFTIYTLQKILALLVRWVKHDTILSANSERHTPLGKSGHMCKDNIKMNINEMCNEVMDGIHVFRDVYQWWALVNMKIKRLYIEWATISFSRRTMFHGVSRLGWSFTTVISQLSRSLHAPHQVAHEKVVYQVTSYKWLSTHVT